jgi:diguanylate cyclase (GGDEF)-like protein
VSRIYQRYDQDPSVFSEAVEDLTPIMKRQEESFTRNVSRVLKACEGAEKVAYARRLIREEISSRLVDRDVPEMVLELLRLGWPKLLFVSLLREGSDSHEWRDNLALLDQLLLILSNGGTAAGLDGQDIKGLLAAIENGLDYICSYSQRLKRLLAELGSVLDEIQAGGPVSQLSMRQVDQPMVDTLLGYSVDSDIAAQEAFTDEGLWDDKVGKQREYLLKAKSLKTGDWLQYMHPSFGRQLVKLVWMDEAQLHHVFVDRRGLKALELGFHELASQLKNGVLAALEETETSLFDRGLHRMLQQMHERLAFQATHDPQTGLLNRKEFYKRLEFALSDSKPQHEGYVLCHVDFGNFMLIKSACGYSAEEELLQQIVAILESKTEQDVTLARLGDTMFGLLLDRYTEADAFSVAEALRDIFRDYRFIWRDESHSVTTSTGLVKLSDDCDTVDELIEMADTACYAAKDLGINRVQIYHVDDAELAHRKGVVQWITRINTVLEKGGLALYCQRISPLMDDVAMHRHYEVLMRVVADDGGHLSPITFIKAAELSNRMVDVDKWVILNVFDWMLDNLRFMHRFGGFAINLSGCSLNDPGFLDFLLEALERTKVPTDKICFEVTETAAIYNLSSAAEFIERVKNTGCRFALDDFGSGMSSYSYLKHLPVDYVKIDGIFVRDIASSESDYAMVKSINEICHFLGKQTIAEFIEDEKIRDSLLEIGVDYAQGYFIEKPRPLKSISASDFD